MANGRGGGKSGGGGRNQRGAKYFPVDRRSGVSITGSLAEALEQFSKDLQTHVFRSAAHAGSIVLYEEMKKRAPEDKGTLRDSIYRYHDEKKSTATFQQYLIGPNKNKAQHWFVVEYGHWRYNASAGDFWRKSKSKKNARVSTPGVMDKSVHDLPGALDKPEWVPEVPYIRPTFTAAAERAIQAARERVAERMQELKNGVPDGD